MTTIPSCSRKRLAHSGEGVGVAELVVPLGNFSEDPPADPRYINMGENFDGTAPLVGDWMLIAYEATQDHDRLKVVLAHELMHLNGYDHPEDKPEENEAFKKREEICSGLPSYF